jgi:predicted permease
VESLVQDLKYGFRSFMKVPLLTAVAVFSLALGIGANTALFSVVNAILLRPIALNDPDRLLVVWETNPRMIVDERSGNEVAMANFTDWQEQNQTFEGLTALIYSNLNLTEVGEPERLQAAAVFPNFFSVAGASPVKGRSFVAEEGIAGQHRVAVLSHGLWQSRFASDPNIIDKSVMLNGIAYTVVGVMAPDFILQFPSTRQIDLWVPLVLTPEAKADRTDHFLYVLGRTKQGASLEQARSDMNIVATRLQQLHPESNEQRGIKLVPIREFLVGNTRPALLVLMGAVAFVLLIACANVANLLLARAASRQKEIAVRIALGATRYRLIRQALTESLLLSLIAGAFGLLFAAFTIKVLVSLSPSNIPRIKEAGLDGWVLAFTLLIAILTGLIFGLAPALQASNPNTTESLKEGGIGAMSGSISHRLRKSLVIIEVALSLVLLIAGGLMVRSFIRLMQVDMGFGSKNVITFQIAPPRNKYPGPPQLGVFYQQLLERLRNAPGVEAVGASSILPLSGGNLTNGFTIEGQSQDDSKDNEAGYRVITPGYLQAISIALINGRDFADADSEKSPQVAIINEAFAKKYFSQQDPIGRHMTITDGKPDWREIVGVIANVRDAGLNEEAKPEMFVPFAQSPNRLMMFAARGRVSPENLVPPLRSEVWSIDSGLPVFAVKTMDQMILESVAKQRFNMLLLSMLAGVALVLASVGLYSLIAYLVGQRTHEIGIRMALGAQYTNIMKLVVGQGLTLTLTGVIIGLALAFILTRLMATLLYEVSTMDTATFLITSLLLALVALLASYFPARRAAKIEPLMALRYE